MLYVKFITKHCSKQVDNASFMNKNIGRFYNAMHKVKDNLFNYDQRSNAVI